MSRRVERAGEESPDLKVLLARFGLRQSDFAKLLGVSSRAVNMWAAGDVGVPGPVAGYLRLLDQLSPAQREDEFQRLPGRGKMFEDGVYRFQYSARLQGETDTGQALCVLRGGKIFGCDPWGGEFGGSYTFNPVCETTRVVVVLKTPPGFMLVTGLSAGSGGEAIEIGGSLKRTDPVSNAIFMVAGAPVDIALTYLGRLPR